jgi:hypothetical protein
MSDNTPTTPSSDNETEAWFNQIDSVIDGTAELNILAQFMMTLVDEDLVTVYPDGEAGALSRRVIWTFPDGVVLWTGKDEDLYVSHLTEEYNEDSAPIGIAGEGDSVWDWNEDANGWAYGGSYGMKDLIDNLTASHGKPTLVLPWSSQIDNVVGEDLEDLVDYYDFDTEDEEERAKYEKLVAFFALLQEGGIKVLDDAWDISLDYGDGFMPKFSKAGRFGQFLAGLEDEGWGIIYDECCGSCSSGSMQWLKEDRPGEDFPIFLTWGQNSDSTWGVNGSINHMHLAGTNDEVAFLLDFAPKYGLEITAEDKSDDSVPFVYIS